MPNFTDDEGNCWCGCLVDGYGDLITHKLGAPGCGFHPYPLKPDAPREPDVPLEVVERVLSEAMRVEDAMGNREQPSLLAEKRIVGCGRFSKPEDPERPYWVALEWFKGRQPVIQPCSEADFFKLVHKLLEKYPVFARVELV